MMTTDVFCTNCGSKTRPDQPFCASCGTAQHSPVVTTTTHTAEPPVAVLNDQRGLALASFLCGLVGVLFAVWIIFFFIYVPLGVVAIVLGIMARHSSRRKLAWWGVGLGVACFVVPVLLVASAV